MPTFPAFLAAAAAQPPAASDKFLNLPKETWINLGITLLVIVFAVKLWKALKKINDFAPWFAAILACLLLCFYWIYERKEPAFLTPVVDKLALFLPTKAKQQQEIEKARADRQN